MLLLGLTNDSSGQELTAIAPISSWKRVNAIIDMLRITAVEAFGPDGTFN